MAGIDRVGHVVLWVSEVAKQVAFYRDVVGMQIVNFDEEKGEAFMSFGTQHHDIGLFKDKGGDSRGSLGLAHIAFHMPGDQDELRQMHERMRDAGARIDRTTDHGMTLSVYFLDPEGNRLEVYTDSLAADEGLAFMRENGGLMKTLDLEKAAT